jgi:hypothetical protein
MLTAGWVFDDVRHDIEVIFVEEGVILGFIQTFMENDLCKCR